MKNRLAAIIALMIVATACHDDLVPTQSGPAMKVDKVTPASPARSGIPNEYIVVFNREVADPPGLARGLATAHGASVRFNYGHAIKGFAAHMSAAAAAALEQNPNVAYVEQDQEVTVIGSPQTMDAAGDPWGLDRIDARSGLDLSYNYSLDGSGVYAYIIDSGILMSHTEFGGRAVGGFTAVADGRGTSDCNGHGTHVAGTVGGSTYGVAKAVHLVAVRVMDCSGMGRISWVIAGIDWVTANHKAIGTPAVANMSLGGVASVAQDQAVQASIAAGVAYAIAAGNGNSNSLVAQDACLTSPGRVPEAMTIGATDKTDTKASWSNYGNCIDWFAPGVGIRSAKYTSDTASNLGSGTSMATPHTTGVAALYLQQFPTATPQQVRDGLYGASTKGIVRTTNGLTANSHLLFTPPEGFGSLSPLHPTTLAVTTSKIKTNWTATLIWSGFSAAVDVYKDGTRIATGVSGSSYKDSGKGTSSMTYRVCQVQSAGNCTNTVTVKP